MKVKEIIKEFRNYFNENEYGSWINTKTENILSVPFEKHRAVMLDYMEDHGIKNEEPYNWAFKNGWIKLTHFKRNEIDISGYYNNIKKIWRDLCPQLLRLDYILVSFKDGGNIPYVHYSLPEDKQQLIKFEMPDSFVM